MALAPIIQYNAYIISPGYNLAISGAGTPNLTATYDDFPTDASGVVAHCTLSISYTNIQYVINNDNSVTVTGNISGAQLVRTATGVTSSQSQLITALFNGSQTFSQTVASASSGTYNLNIPNSFSVTIPPSNNPQPQGPAAIQFRNDNTTSTAPYDEFYLGILITNPNPPDYRPGAILDGSNLWQSHNRSGGTSHILTGGGTWAEMRTEGGLSAYGNPPAIRYQDKWSNMREIGKE